MFGKTHKLLRQIFGVAFLVFGLNGFFHFMPQPDISPAGGALLKAFAQTGYFFPMIKVIEITVGTLLILNILAPLAMIVITPVLVGITTIHLFLNPQGLVMMLLFHIVHGIIVLGYWPYYKKILVIRAKPS